MFASHVLRHRTWATSAVLLATSSAAYLSYRKREENAYLLDHPAPMSPQDIRAPLLWTPPTRDQMLRSLRTNTPISPHTASISPPDSSEKPQEKGQGFDLLIIGGGATGAGTAVDAATRGLTVAMVERDDFSSGTSSKSTKLVHGGIRYLQKAVFELDYEQWKLVREALHERKIFLSTAPYLSHELPIMLPIYKYWQIPYFWSGCKLYDFVAGKANMESSYFLSRGKALEAFPMLKKDGLVGSLVYYDGQHNDSRMNMALIMTAVHHGATVSNYTEVTGLIKEPNASGKETIVGAKMRDVLTGDEWTVKAKGVINAAGPFADGVRKLDDPTLETIVAPSSGVHITLPSYYSPTKMGLIDPSTSDGRVVFFLPWQGNTIAGTTDTPAAVEQNPLPKEEEIQWILGEVRNYLSPDIRVRRGDVLSAWSGLRPLVRNPSAKDSQSLVRSHLIHVSDSNLLTIAGGKWTTYRAMAQETIDAAVDVFNLHDRVRGPCVTEKIKLFGSHGWYKNLYIKLVQQFGISNDVAKHLTDTYGDRAWTVCSISEPTGQRWPLHGVQLDPLYPYIEAEVRYACRREFAQKAIDFIARRSRLAFLNAHAALQSLPRVIDIMSEELGWNSNRKNREFEEAKNFLLSMGLPQSKLKTTIQEIRNGRLAASMNEEDAIISRSIFSVDELDSLTKVFNSLDHDKDGSIGVKDLAEALHRVGYENVPQETLQNMIAEVDLDKDGVLEFTEFLDAASGVKELQLHSAFTRLLGEYDTSTPDVDKQGWKAWWKRKIPVERTGGGW